MMTFARQEKEVSPFIAARSIGEEIKFSRNGFEVVGKIDKILEHSVIVELSSQDAHKIGAKSNLTVVSHKKYTVKSS